MRNLLRFGLVFVCTTALSGCFLFSDEDDPFDIPVRESIPISFSIDAADLCPPNADCTDPNGSPDDVQTPDIELPPIPLDIVMATGSSELADAAGRVKRVEIESIEYEYADNTLNTEGPRVLLYIGSLNATSRQGATEIVDLPGVNSEGTPDSGTAEIADDKKEAASDQFKTLQFSTIPLMRPAPIKRGDAYPTGTTDVNLTLNLKFVLNPIDAL